MERNKIISPTRFLNFRVLLVMVTLFFTVGCDISYVYRMPELQKIPRVKLEETFQEDPFVYRFVLEKADIRGTLMARSFNHTVYLLLEVQPSQTRLQQHIVLHNMKLYTRKERSSKPFYLGAVDSRQEFLASRIGVETKKQPLSDILPIRWDATKRNKKRGFSFVFHTDHSVFEEFSDSFSEEVDTLTEELRKLKLTIRLSADGNEETLAIPLKSAFYRKDMQAERTRQKYQQQDPYD